MLRGILPELSRTGTNGGLDSDSHEMGEIHVNLSHALRFQLLKGGKIISPSL